MVTTVVKFKESESTKAVARGLGAGNGSYCLMTVSLGKGFQFGKLKKVLDMDGGDGCTLTSTYLRPWNYTHKNS